MFYAGLEGRKFGLARGIACGLRGALYNIVYPPAEDEATIEDFDILINPQSYRLPYESATWSPKLAEHLRQFGPVDSSELVEFDVDGIPRSLNAAGQRLCRSFLALQRDYHASDIMAPYFSASSLDDPGIETSLLCAEYLADHAPDDNVFAGIMLDASHLTNETTFERLANRLTSPDSPQLYFFDIDASRSVRRPLRNVAVLSKMKLLFDALDASGKYSLLGRCDLEGLLLFAVSGLDAFSVSYYHSDRQSLHRTLLREYERPEFIRSPTPYVFSPALLSDIPRDVAQNIIRDGKRRLLSCGCSACAELIKNNVSGHSAVLCPSHFYERWRN